MSSAKKLSPWRRLLGLLLLIVVIVVGLVLGLVTRGHRESAPIPPGAIPAAVFIVLGTIVEVLALAAYGLVLLTNAFIFDFRRPFLEHFQGKLWTANLVVGVLAASGVAFMAEPQLEALMTPIVPPQIVGPAGFFVPFILVQILLAWLQIWAPLEGRIIRRRMYAIGVPPERVAAGMLIGTSSPNQRGIRMGMVEEDLGMMWLDDDRLVYYGDRGPWAIARDRLVEVERAATGRDTSAYFGAVHVILRFIGMDGTEHRIRLHTEGDWTQTARARALDALADRLASWKEGSAISLPPAEGFPVVNSTDGLESA